MIIRDYEAKDFEEIKAIHDTTEINYNFPDVNSPLFLVKKVVVSDGKVVAAAMWRIEVETYLFLDKNSALTPQQRMDTLRDLQIEGLDALWMQGIDNAVCWVPEEIEHTFGKRLVQLGWSRDRDGWHSWSRVTEAKEKSNAL